MLLKDSHTLTTTCIVSLLSENWPIDWEISIFCANQGNVHVGALIEKTEKIKVWLLESQEGEEIIKNVVFILKFFNDIQKAHEVLTW